jgi:phage recombination protein Bet
MTNVIAHPTALRPFRISDEVKRVLRANHYPRGDDEDLLTDAEFEDFVVICQQRQMDPLHRHIYATKRWNTKRGKKIMSVEATIDGLRLTAERTGRYRGQTRTLWSGADGRWLDAWLPGTPPMASTVGVWRESDREPLFAVAHYTEFVQTYNDGNVVDMWVRKPRLMLAKCAEALALRKAFPAELGGLYTAEELVRMDESTAAAPTTRAAADVVVAGIGGLAETCARLGLSIVAAHSLAHLASSGAQVDALLEEQALRACRWAADLVHAGVDEPILLDAVSFAIEHSTGWEAAQSSFERWVVKKQEDDARHLAPNANSTPDRLELGEHVPLRAVVA